MRNTDGLDDEVLTRREALERYARFRKMRAEFEAEERFYFALHDTAQSFVDAHGDIHPYPQFQRNVESLAARTRTSIETCELRMRQLQDLCEFSDTEITVMLIDLEVPA